MKGNNMSRQDATNSFMEDSPRLTLDDTITFRCGPDVPCFNECCHDLSLMLTGYDVLRLRTHLGLSSGEFIDTYTDIHSDGEFNLPLLRLKMLDDERKSCPFLTDKGCSVYEDRPWACRSYPVGSATSVSNLPGRSGQFYFLIKEDHCKGFEQDRTITVREWVKDQDIQAYEENNDFFKDLTRYRKTLQSGMGAARQQMFFMACYNLERFRDFVLKSSFLRKFEVDEETLENIKTDDTALLRFAYRWLRFSMFSEDTLSVRSLGGLQPQGRSPSMP